MARKKNRVSTDINAGSMADIAFLLLIFFLVTTTMDIDTGISIKLPPMPKDEQIDENAKINERNVLTVLVNSRNQLLVENQFLDIRDLKMVTKEFISNPLQKPTLAENPQKAVISLKNDRGTSYNTYISVQNELKAAYNELRNEEALRKHGKKYSELKFDRQKEIQDMYPQKISEAEPENVGGN